MRDSATGAVKGIGFVEFEDPSSVQLAIREAAIKRGDAPDTPQGLVIGGRELRVQAWKSIKKAKETTRLRTGRKPTRRQEQNSTGTGGSILRIPTNLRGVAARKQFVKRTLQKRAKRKHAEAVAGGGSKKKKTPFMKSKKDKIKKPRTKR